MGRVAIMSSASKAGQKFHCFRLRSRCRGASDLVVSALGFTDAHDLLLQRNRGPAAFARVIPVDRYQIAGDQPAPATVGGHVEERGAPGLLAAARQRTA